MLTPAISDISDEDRLKTAESKPISTCPSEKLYKQTYKH